MVWLITIFFILFFLFEVASYLIYRSKSFEGLKNLYDSILKRKSPRDDIGTFALRYAEHPFLAMTLNPEFINSLGEKIHNKYGFRNKEDFLDTNNKNPIIYCAGSSTTYGNFIERNEDTWPCALEAKLDKTLNNKRIRVINAACGGWTIFQSLIRFCGWVDVLKPKLVIVYHGITDFWPFTNSESHTPEIFPDYSNVMRSLRLDPIAKKALHFTRYTYTSKVFYGLYIKRKYMNVLWHVYNKSKPTMSQDIEKGLKKIGPREWKFIISRYHSFASLCKDRDISIIFVTEKATREIYKPYLHELNRRIMALEDRNRNCFVYDFANEVQGDNEKMLQEDGGHFTETGARIFAECIKDYLIKNTSFLNFL